MIDLEAEATQILSKYPSGRGRSALLPLLHRAQDRDGYVTQEAMEEIAGILGLSAAEVLSVASFYTMFHLRPKGRHVVSVCHNLACSMNGAEKLIQGLESYLGVKAGETTHDREFTLERVECLAACELAPMMQIDYHQMHGPIRVERAVEILEEVGTAQVQPEPVDEPHETLAPVTLPAEPHQVEQVGPGTVSTQLPAEGASKDYAPAPVTDERHAAVEDLFQPDWDDEDLRPFGSLPSDDDSWTEQ